MLGEISVFGWMSGAIVFAIGGGTGYFIARQIKDKRTLELEKKLEAAQHALNDYQEEVQRHFLKTSLLFNKLTDNYREVYEHLASGAQNLCHKKPSVSALDLPETKILGAAHGDTENAPAGNNEEAAAVSPNKVESRHDEEVGPESMIPTDTLAGAHPDTPAEEVVDTLRSATMQQDHTPTDTFDSAPTEASAKTDGGPSISAEELKELEANEAKKKHDEDIPLGAESTPGVEPEHHKTHPSIH